MATLPLTTKISQQSQAQVDQKFMVSSYGNGYEQRVAMGRNSFDEVWDLQWNLLTTTERATMVAFYRAHGRVVSFDWTPPNGTAGKWIFNSPLTETNTSLYFNLGVQVRKVYE